MRNGFLGSLLLLAFGAVPAVAQTPTAQAQLLPPAHTPVSPPVTTSTWPPPRTDLDDRPNVGPAGYRYYGSVEFLMWWTEKDSPVPALTTNPAFGAANAVLPETTDYSSLFRNGGRAILGMWFNQQQSVSAELGGFWTCNRAPRDAGQYGEVAALTKFNSDLWASNATLRAEVYRGTWVHFDALAGFSFLSLDEGLGIAEHDSTPGVITSDRFGTRNRFYGGFLGAESELHYKKWFVDIWGKVGLGLNDEAVSVNGTTLSGTQLTPGGLLVSGAVAGRYHRHEFAVLPEFGINFGYHLTQHLRATAGYTFIYLSEAVRPAEQIDALLQAPNSSAFPFQGSDFWVQGLNFGLEFRF